MSYDLVIRGGTLVHPWGRVEADLGVRGETIAAIATPGETLAGKREIDARGRYVLPGRIDPHVHMHWPDWPMEEAIPISSRAALAGGTTTLIHFILSTGSLLEHFAEMKTLSDAKAHSDGTFHGGIVSEAHIGEIPELARQGATSFKFWMSYRGEEAKPPLQGIDDGVLFRGFREVDRLGPGAVALVHAENIEVFFDLRDELKASGRTTSPGRRPAPPSAKRRP